MTHRTRGSPLAFTFLQVIALAICVSAFASCRRADAAPSDGRPSLAIEYFQVDSARVIAKWSRPCDGKGCADAFDVRWTAGVQLRQVKTLATTDTFKLQRPAIGDSLLATVTVASVRRGNTGPTRTASSYVRNPDAAPPPVDSLKVDTSVVARIDSLRMRFETLTGVALAGAPVALNEHDTIRIVAHWYVKPGRSRQPGDTTLWSGQRVDETSPFLTLQPIGPGFHADTAVLIAESCNCRESGDAENRPRLDLRRGEYVVRDRYGGSRPVTAIAANAFGR